MRKKILFTFVAIAMCILSVNAQQLVKNGNCEKWPSEKEGENNVPNGYRVASVEGVCFSKGEGRGESGYSIKISNRGKSSSNRLVTPAIDFDKTGKGTYQLSFYTKGTGKLTWINLSKSRSSTGGALLIPDSQKKLQSADWQKHEFDFAVSDTSVDYYLFFLIKETDGGDPIFLDDISLKKK